MTAIPKHTPGPWRNDLHKGGCIYAGDVFIADVWPEFFSSDAAPDSELQANASLISSAPELYAVAKTLVDDGLIPDPECPECRRTTDVDMHPTPMRTCPYHLAINALAKAEGR